MVPDDIRNVLSLERTRLAADRTLMAWIRPAFSMITFGFAVVKFFEFLRERSAETAGSFMSTPRALGVLLIGAGTASLLAGAWEYRVLLLRLRQLGDVQRASVAVLVGVFDVLALVGVLLPPGAL